MNIWNAAGIFLVIFFVGSLMLIRWIAIIDKDLSDVEDLLYGEDDEPTIVIRDIDLSADEIVKRLSVETRIDMEDSDDH